MILHYLKDYSVVKTKIQQFLERSIGTGTQDPAILNDICYSHVCRNFYKRSAKKPNAVYLIILCDFSKYDVLQSAGKLRYLLCVCCLPF